MRQTRQRSVAPTREEKISARRQINQHQPQNENKKHDLQPVNHLIMSTPHHELIHHPIDPHHPPHHVQPRILRVSMHEMVFVEARQMGLAHAARHRGDVVDVRLRHHGGHGGGYVARGELVVAVFVPDGAEVEVGASEQGLEEGERVRVRRGDGGGVVGWGGGEDPVGS